MGETKSDEHYQRLVNRPYYYGYAAAGKTIYAYTKGEWGIGASSGGGDHKTIRSFYFSLFLMALTIPATLVCATLAVIAVFKFPLMTLFLLVVGAVFGLGVIQGYFNLAAEWKGRKLRKLTGLPKPWFTASDDHAREWFLEHPDPRIQMTSEYFPGSATLRRSEAQGTL